MRRTYEALRKRTITKLANPRLKRITFHTFRHWKGTTEYHKTKDILHVKTVLGHKAITSTMAYINLESAIFHTADHKFYVKTAKTVDEASKLIELGFEYVQEMNGINIYRKRK